MITIYEVVYDPSVANIQRNATIPDIRKFVSSYYRITTHPCKVEVLYRKISLSPHNVALFSESKWQHYDKISTYNELCFGTKFGPGIKTIKKFTFMTDKSIEDLQFYLSNVASFYNMSYTELHDEIFNQTISSEL